MERMQLVEPGTNVADDPLDNPINLCVAVMVPQKKGAAFKLHVHSQKAQGIYNKLLL